MKKTLLFLTTLLLLFLLPFGQTLSATAASGSSSSNNGTDYVVNPLHYFVASNAADLALHKISDVCTTGSGLMLHCYTPQIIQSAYNFTGAYKQVGGYAKAGAGQTIVIVDAYGSPTIMQDLLMEDQTYNIPRANLNIVCPQGCPTFNYSSATEISWSLETTLDVEYSHAMAPAATIELVVAKSGSFANIFQAEQTAFNIGLGNIWSQSFGGYGCATVGFLNSSTIAANELLYKHAAAAGVTLITSSGDNGGQNGCAHTSPEFPAVSPYNLAVGGTHLNVNGKGNYMSETVWNDEEDTFVTHQGAVFAYATGGAPLANGFYPPPKYQSGISVTPVACGGPKPGTCIKGSPYSPTGRTTSDVSFNADIDGGVLTYWSTVSAGFYIVGGTSAGSPQWASIIAIADQLHSADLGFVNPMLYSLASSPAFHDITAGTNSFEPGLGFAATPGYDAPTGLGSPNVGILVLDL